MSSVIIVEVELHEDDAELAEKGQMDNRTAIMASVKDGYFEIIRFGRKEKETCE